MKTKAFLLFISLLFIAHAVFSQAQVRSARGTGRTTGHIVTLFAYNPGKKPVTADFGPYFIPSNGKDQSYVVPGTTTVTIPPKSEVEIPLIGFCSDNRRPPVSDGEDMPPYSSWVQVDPAQPVSFDWTQKPGSGITTAPAGPRPIPTILGTDTPLGVSLNIDIRPDLAGPLLVSVANKIQITFDSLRSVGGISTPFSNNRDRERESVIQQTLWWYTAALRGDEYTEEQFEERMTEQLETNTGKKKEELPPQMVEQFDAGVADFWDSFTLVGVEAKVISTPDKTTEAPPSIPPAERLKKADCIYDTDLTYNPEFDFDMKIADSWGDEAERKGLIEKAEAALARNMNIDNENVFENYDISRHPTSATAFWKVNHVGGFASAYARARFTRADDGATEWVWNTESLETNAQGSSEITLRFEHDADCSSMVVGTSLSRIKASGKVFDAVAGNDPNSLPVLRVYTWLGKQAILFLIERKTGKTKSSFGKYLKDNATQEAKDVLKEELESKGMEILDEILDELGIDLDDLDATLPDLSPPDLQGMLEDIIGIKIPSLEEGVDAAFNLFFFSNTYATAFGAMNIWVGGKSGTVMAKTRKFYQRKGLEDKREAVHGTSDECRELLLTDARPGSLTIKTQGFSTMTCKADGNGSAQANLESMHVELLIGVCFCPDRAPQVVETSLSGWYSLDRSINQSVLKVLERDAKNHIQRKLDDGSLTARSSPAAFSKALEDFMKQWSAINSSVKRNCD
jgi:hypothetical protein